MWERTSNACATDWTPAEEVGKEYMVGTFHEDLQAKRSQQPIMYTGENEPAYCSITDLKNYVLSAFSVYFFLLLQKLNLLQEHEELSLKPQHYQLTNSISNPWEENTK